MRKILAFSIVLIFNIGILYGFKMVNKTIFNNDLMIYLNKKEVEKPASQSKETDSVISSNYSGEDIEKIGNKIDSFLKESYIDGYGKKIAEASVKKNVNPYLIGAIVIVNSNCQYGCEFKTTFCNNVGDLKGAPGCVDGKYKKYDTIEESITDLVKYVNDTFISKLIDNPYNMYKTYGKDINWAFKVSSYMEKLKI